ncbi:MAG: polysaccharide biosynthesis C-terminal domain-containing protein, partial [Fusobacteriaceae bacterium]|nr:polysaccharide biosynthesis C-terminal domain-containing protein [Fusobacteriaceae bacterium]
MVLAMEVEVKQSTLIQLTLPIFLELLLMTVVGNIDIIMVSKFSDKGVGVLGGMSQILYTQSVIFSFISIGTGILISQYVGAKKQEKIFEVIGVSLLLNIIISLILGIIYWYFAHDILAKIKLSEELISIGINYFRVVGGICIFQAVTVTASSALRSFGYAKIPLYINVLINLINILMNGMFLFGWMGAPILGVTGVGIATIFSRMIGFIIALSVLKKYCKFS